jgi:hypothetical protein
MAQSGHLDTLNQCPLLGAAIVLLGLGEKAMRRRNFIKGVVGSAAVWPLAARAQQGERVRHIDILMNADDPDLRSQHSAFLQFLKQLGWIDGRNVQIDTRWSKGPADIRRYALELAALAPDIIVVTGTAGMFSDAGSHTNRADRLIPENC